MQELVYKVKPCAHEVVKPGDRVHRLHDSRIFDVLEVAETMVRLAPVGVRQADFWLGRELFDEQVVYGGEAMRVYGRVTLVTS